MRDHTPNSISKQVFVCRVIGKSFSIRNVRTELPRLSILQLWPRPVVESSQETLLLTLPSHAILDEWWCHPAARPRPYARPFLILGKNSSAWLHGPSPLHSTRCSRLECFQPFVATKISGPFPTIMLLFQALGEFRRPIREEIKRTNIQSNPIWR